MKLVYIGIFGLFLSFFGLFFAQPDMDAKSVNVDYITDQYMRAIDTRRNFDRFSKLAIAEMEPALAALNIEIIDGNKLVYELFADFRKATLIELRATLRESFYSQFTREEVALLADFYRSEIGQDLISSTAAQGPQDLEKIDFFQNGEGQRLLQKIGHVISASDDFSERNFALNKGQITMNRLADIAEIDGILKFQSETHRRELVEAMRGME